MKQYTLVSETSPNYMNIEVSKYQKERYDLYGDLVVISHKEANNVRAKIVYSQWMVKNE
jgi:hypothetical protein